MANEPSGNTTRLEIELPAAEDDDEGEKTTISYNHQLAISLGHASSADDSQNVPEVPPVSESAISLPSQSPSTDAAPAFNALPETPSEGGEAASFHFEKVGNTAIVKRTRGRPRKDFQRPPKHHLSPSSVTAKVMRGRGRPRRDDILHHKIFPGRPRFRGRKFPSYIMSLPAVQVPGAQSNQDIYENIDTLRAACDGPEKMLISSDGLPDNELKVKKFCAFCNLSESSVLGQGKFAVFKPTPDFDSIQAMNEKSLTIAKPEVPDAPRNELKILFRKQKSVDSTGEQMKIQRSKSLQNLQDRPTIMSDLIQELEVTGFKSVPESKNIFETNGELHAHFNCAAWSEGVTKTFEKKLFNVDKAVVTAAFQKCSKCHRYGASVKCCFSDCTKIYHYPCAIVSGALQNANCFKIICSVHREHAFSFGVICMVCHESGDLSQLILCTSCGSYYHGNCMDPSISPSHDVRAGWQCLDCKVCQNCRRSEDMNNKMLICSACDKGFHVFCLKPALSSVPKSGWKCYACRKCGDCGARTPGNGPSSRWHMNFTVCDSCYQQRNKGIACPLCKKAYRQFSQRKAMKHCTICQKYIHDECDRRIGINPMDYVCPICMTSGNQITDDTYVEHHIKDSFQGSSRDSFLSGNEESQSSEESDCVNDTVASNKIPSRRTSSELRQKKPPKPRLKSLQGQEVLFPMSQLFSQKEYKIDDDDPTEDNRMVIAAATDEFVLCQDLCVMCGSFGKGEEGKLVACAQCGQCYHSYCASIKVTLVVLKKGWRCLDCTVCEGCGQPHDEGRLLLCDECDISFHIYCLDPPLQEVPQGNWKCKWCVVCTKCGSKSPGLNCDWQLNYTLCGPCASFRICCWCHQYYEENDLIVQCGRCERWLHGLCDQIETEDQADKCAEYGYNCPHCRSPDELPPHLLPPPSPPTPEEPIPEKHPSPVLKIKEPEPPPPVVVKTKPPIQYFMDGVCLSESGMNYIRSLQLEQPKKIPRPRKPRLGMFGLQDSTLQFEKMDTTTPAGSDEPKSEQQHTSLELGLKAYDFEDDKKDSSEANKDGVFDDKKKRPRKLQKLGIGGFIVKPRGRCSSTKDSIGESGEISIPAAEPPVSTPSEKLSFGAESDFGGGDKPKRKRKQKKKTQLDESFPSYLREAFFGKELLISCKKLGRSSEMRDATDISSENSSNKTKHEPELPKAPQTPSAEPRVKVPADVKPQDVKDFLSTAAVSAREFTNPSLTYKSIIKSEIESIKEEQLSSASLKESAGLKYNMDNPLSILSPGLPGSLLNKGGGPYLMQQSPTHQSILHPNLLQNLNHPDSNSSWPDTECDQTQMQKNLLKWEADEQLGLLSTISPVLYANINLQHLKIEYPAWTDRVKQIAKIWRSLPPEKRQPYLQRARENRAASRTQRSSSTDSDRSTKDKAPDSDSEKQWKQLQHFRQMQQQAQQRLIQEQRQAALKARSEKAENTAAMAELDKNIKLIHSKSLSEIPQFPNRTVTEENLVPNSSKIIEKRWSSSAVDLNSSENLLQQQTNRLPTENHPSLQKSMMQDRVAQSLLHVSKVRAPLESSMSLMDASLSPSNPIKSEPPFHSTQPSPTTQFTALNNSRNTNPLLICRTDGTRVGTPTIKKEAVNTPPPTPRPHSSDSFFQMSTSPQSQLLASLDTHSQPTPARSKLIGTPSASEAQQSSTAGAQDTQSPSKVPSSPSVTLSNLPPDNSKVHTAQNALHTVEQFLLQQQQSSGSFQASNILKQLPPQYKDACLPITSASEKEALLSQDKRLEEQNLESMLQASQASLPYSNRLAAHQHLRDLLQNKAPDSPLPTRTEDKMVRSEPNIICSVGNIKLSDVMTDSTNQNRAFQTAMAAEQQTNRRLDIPERPESQSSSHKEFLLGHTQKESQQSSYMPLAAVDQEMEDELCADPNTKNDLMNDLENPPEEEQDVLGGNCNLDVLNVGDVGELELDDDELLGLGNDFNILEYADPELDKNLGGEGEKSNILDEHLDLDDKDEELTEEVIKEDAQDKDLLSHGEKKGLEMEGRKSVDESKSNILSDNFLDFNKKDLDSRFQNLPKSLDGPIVQQMTSTVKEEPKQVFSSCTLSSQSFSPSVDIKLEKSAMEHCNRQKTHSLPFNPEVQNISASRAEVQHPDQLVPPPSYRMVTALKQRMGAVVQQPSSPQHTLTVQNKSVFPLHLNMNLRQELSLAQQNVLAANVQQNKPLLLQEQPLLLEDLVEQEKREQRRQTQDGLISPHGDALLSDIDFERLKDDVFSGPPDDSLGGPGSLLGGHDPTLSNAVPNISVPSSPSSHNFGPPPYSLLWQNQEPPNPLAASRQLTIMQNLKTKTAVSTLLGSLGMSPGSGLPQKAAPAIPGNVAATLTQSFVVPAPENPPPTPESLIDPEKLKLINYEKYLMQQHSLLSSRQKYFETEVIKLRKAKKALNAKQRQLRKNGAELAENDAVELARVSQEQAALQKQLDQVRKQSRQNTLAVQDYRLKQQKRQQQQQQQLQQSQQGVPRSPLHPSVSSLQSSPQNSQSPHQFNAPQSPMVSPLGPPSSLRMQHATPLMQSHQQNIHAPLFSQQLPLQFQVAQQTNDKSWVKMSPQNDNLQQQGDRFVKKENFENTLNQQSFPAPTTTASSLMDTNLKSLLDIKKLPEDMNNKKFFEQIATSSATSDPSEGSNFPSKMVSAEGMQITSMLKEEKSLSDPLKDSVLPYNTIQRPELPSKISDVKTTLPSSDIKVEIKDFPKVADQPVIDNSKQDVIKTEQQASNSAEVSLITNLEESRVSAPSEPLSSAEQKPGSLNSEPQELEKKSEQDNKPESDEQIKTDILLNIKQEIVDDAPSLVENSTSNRVEDKIMEKDADSSTKESKKEEADGSSDEELKYLNCIFNIKGSSDEELENLTKTVADKEREQAEQNVLLKQLLQNCPSAETPRKSTESLLELQKEDDLSKLDLQFDMGSLDGKDKLDDAKAKKQSYLDIRRAQLEKEPTPPPGEKPKPIKRKRPKKKKLEEPVKTEGGVVLKKKCRRSSSKLEEGYENYVENMMNKLTTLPPLRIIEPNIKPNFSAVPVFGSGDLNIKDNQLKGRLGCSTIPGQNDIYSYHPYTNEHPPSLSILPPSSPPYRGFYNQEFPGMNKAIEKNEIDTLLKSSELESSNKIFRDAGSPDTVISSSSPESCIFEQKSKWPLLVFVDKLLPEKKRNGSPVIPLMYPIPIRAHTKAISEADITEMDIDKDKENIPDEDPDLGLLKTKMSGLGGYSAPLKDSGNVAVTLTLTSAAAEDICGVLSALADLLKIPIPASYEIVERTATPPSQKLGLYRRSKNSEVSIHSLLNGKPRFCRHCDIVVLSAGIRKKASDLACMSKEEQEEDEVIFCSTNCYMQFALTHRSTAVLEEKEAATVVDHIGETTYEKSNEDSLSSFMDEKDILRTLNETPDISKLEAMDIDENESSLMMLGKSEKSLDNPYNLDFALERNEAIDTMYRKWRSIKYRYFSSDGLASIKPRKREDSSEKAGRPFYHTIKPSQMPKDERKCIFCHGVGDGDTNGAARLLNVDVNKWVHLNCALWSYEVYETVNGALMNVETAYKRSRHNNCTCCHKHGASVRCFKTRCLNIYHFPCARKEQCSFYKDKTMLCPHHAHRGNIENKLDSLAVFRRVYINREEHKQIASIMQDDKYLMRVGSLIFLNIGQLLPSQLQSFHNNTCIFPVGYKVIRMYWSMRKLGRRSQYTCLINDVNGKPEFNISVKETDQKEIFLKDVSSKGVWQKVLYPIEKMRKQAKTIKMFPDFITGDDLFGLTEPAVLRIIESLPGVETLNDYNFRYGRSPFLELPLAINPTGCARSEPKLRTHFKRPHTLLHSSTTTRTSFVHSAFTGMETSSPYVKQFVHSKSSQYRKMKIEWRNNVYLARSRIQGLGLYAAKDLEKHTMVIEYIGHIIRNEISDRNEARYDAQNRGVYMFRLDENRVIDATLSGGLARYINHSCNPNCVAENVQIDRENKILIITNRRIPRGEELSYDYKFDVEDDQHKIPCLCGAPNCRKWMN
ncbi:histone-lysine N-methyltransferase 2C isoform X4 [Parasteatoda tepidariorum]|uniref:histone-lysine N-methyltransferase 2C isoform X4 n=1 Tax=Parasteatoda tepidariorum TaxID=114398 RepID=UPI001C729A6D|nr:histone-lysine N-methyltransferase 2C isoform X1 [Parasteatoda tepidariorum]XP_042908868.1 histone-lysine N-methyltransferase 2C isoform X1 [Parasteatoda tepidariorum]